MTQITTRKNELTIDKEFAGYMRPMTSAGFYADGNFLTGEQS